MMRRFEQINLVLVEVVGGNHETLGTVRETPVAEAPLEGVPERLLRVLPSPQPLKGCQPTFWRKIAGPSRT